jgi:hypothetical protein
VLADVLRDVAAGFPDSEWVHLGFDEVDPPRCTALRRTALHRRGVHACGVGVVVLNGVPPPRAPAGASTGERKMLEHGPGGG